MICTQQNVSVPAGDVLTRLRESEARFTFAVEGAGDGVWDWDIPTGRMPLSGCYETMLGYAKGEIEPTIDAWVRSVHPDDLPRAQTNLQAYLEGRIPDYTIELRLRCKDGSYKWVLCRGQVAARDAAGKPVRMVGIHSDITARKRAEEELRIAAIAFEIDDGIIVTDANAFIIRINRAFTRVTGYSAEEVIGKTPAVLSSGRHSPEFYLRLWQNLKDNGYWQGEIWNRRKNGKIYAEWLTISAVRDPQGEITHYVGTFSEISQTKEAEAEIHRLAYYDPLTQLPNRRLLQDRLEQAIAGSRRSRLYCALLLVDLDHFKRLNDTRGHETGDQLLAETAQRLRNCVRQDDTVARPGGDEFVAILEDLGKNRQYAALQAEHIAEKMRQAIARPYEVGGGEFLGTASIGITLFDGAGETTEAVLKHADLALYKAKDAGRNCIRFFDQAMQAALDHHATLEADLRRAVERGELLLYFQPLVDDRGTVIGAEALLRWQHPIRGLVPPAEFIPLAEETDLIVPIGRWVLETGCAQLKSWSANPAFAGLKLAINASARQFRQADFVAQVEEALTKTGADPRRLKIELTESMVLDDIDDTQEKMHALKALGIGIALDDFGTGQSSLSYLTRLPLDQLKIDRSFVTHLPDSRNDAVVAQTIVAMAKGLGLTVVAEGVETELQRQFLSDHGCRLYQGYLYSQPLPLASFEAYVGARIAATI